MLSGRLGYVAGIVLASSMMVGVGCGSDETPATTNADSEINEGRGALERALTPPLAAPTSEKIGVRLADVLATVVGAKGAAKTSGGCTTQAFTNATTKKVVAEHVTCATSEIVRFLSPNGTTTAEHADLNKDGEVDRYTSEVEAVAQVVDKNFDGKVDVVVERVDGLKDFSLAGYDEDFPASSFLYRIREDRNRDGKLDYEKLTARGALPSKP